MGGFAASLYPRDWLIKACRLLTLNASRGGKMVQLVLYPSHQMMPVLTTDSSNCTVIPGYPISQISCLMLSSMASEPIYSMERKLIQQICMICCTKKGSKGSAL